MHLKTLEQHIKDRGWAHDFSDPKIVKLLSEQAADALEEEEKVFSITVGNKIDQEGKPSSTLWLLVLTEKELCFAELDSDDGVWRSTPQRMNINDLRMVEKGQSSLNQNLWRINIISSEKGFVFESIDSTSATHFVNQANELLNGEIIVDTQTNIELVKENVNGGTELEIEKGETKKMDEEEALNLTKSHDFQDLEAINTTTQVMAENEKSVKSREKKDKSNSIFNYFFNFSSLFKSKPAMEMLFLFFEFIWIICDIVFISLFGANKITNNENLILGILMIIFACLGFAILIPYLISIWKVKMITNKARIFILLEVMMLILIVISALVVAKTLAIYFAIPGLMISVIVFSTVIVEFARKLIEWKAQNPEYQQNQSLN